MNGSSLPSLYNPGVQRDDDKFIAEFVARHDLLETLLRRLRTPGSDTLGLHHILIGPRGMGKTSLLRRIAIAIHREPDLSTEFIPLNFREEQYNVLTLGDFWRNCGGSLAEWAEAAGQTDLAQRLDEALPTEAWATDETAAEQFRVEIRALGRRAVLLVDNLDLILDALPDESAWALRRRLQARRGPILIGASTHPLKQSANRDAAFYEFFHPVHLEPLDAKETERCMRALAVNGGEHGDRVVRILDAEPARLRTLHALTAGNPRVLALIYRLLGTGESEAAMADLERLLDQVTPYYKAKIEEYQTAQQRAVIDAIALNWDPVTTGDLADLTRIPSTTLSPLLIRLRKDGLIESVELSGSYAGHQLAERFLNIWYLMRHGTRRTKQKMRWLVAFLTSFYSLNDLTEIAGRVPDRSNMSPEYRLAFDEARQALRIKSEEILRLEMAELDSRIAPQIISFDGGMDHSRSDFRKSSSQTRTSVIDRTTTPVTSDPSSLIQAADAQLEEAVDLAAAGDITAAVKIIDDILARFTDAPQRDLQEMVARALFNKAVILDHMGASQAAITTYADVVARFAEAPEADLREVVAMALVNKAGVVGQIGDTAAAISALDEVVDRFAGAPEPALRERVASALFNKAFTLGQSGDRSAELASYDDLVARFDEAPEPEVREKVAWALVNKAITLGQMGDSAAKLATYDDALSRLADAAEPSLREVQSTVMYNKAVTLGQLNDNASSLATYDQLISRFADASEPGMREVVARALIDKAMMLGPTEHGSAKLAIYDEVLSRFADTPVAGMREVIAKALANKAFALGQMGDSAAKLATYDDLISRFSDATEPVIREVIAKVLVNKANALGQMGDNVGKLTTYEEVLSRFADATEPGLREVVARTLFNKALTLTNLSDTEAKLAAYDEFISRFAESAEVEIREKVAWILINKAMTFAQMGDSAAKLATYEELLSRFGDAPEPVVREVVAKALVNKAIALGQLGDSAGELVTYDEVLSRFAGTPELGIREQVAKALVYKAITFSEMGDTAAKLVAYNQVIALFAEAPESTLREGVAMALVNKAMTLDQMGDSAAALITYEEVLTRFADAPEHALREHVAAAIELKAIMLHKEGKIAAAIESFEKLIKYTLGHSDDFINFDADAAKITLANIIVDFTGDFVRAEELYHQAASTYPLPVHTNLAWLFLLADRLPHARRELEELSDLPAVGVALLNAAIELASDNVGSATSHLASALDGDLDTDEISFGDDLERLLRLAQQRGYGEHLIAWLEQTSLAERLAPLYIAFKAYVRTEKLLLDVNPEVRGPAQIIYDRLDAPRRYAAARTPQKPKPRRPRSAARRGKS